MSRSRGRVVRRQVQMTALYVSTHQDSRRPPPGRLEFRMGLGVGPNLSFPGSALRSVGEGTEAQHPSLLFTTLQERIYLPAVYVTLCVC